MADTLFLCFSVLSSNTQECTGFGDMTMYAAVVSNQSLESVCYSHLGHFRMAYNLPDVLKFYPNAVHRNIKTGMWQHHKGYCKNMKTHSKVLKMNEILLQISPFVETKSLWLLMGNIMCSNSFAKTLEILEKVRHDSSIVSEHS